MGSRGVRGQRSRLPQPGSPEWLGILETPFMWWLIRLAEGAGWLAFHPHDSRKSQGGYPDLNFLRPPRLVIVETKREGEDPRPDQQQWLDKLGRCPGVEVYLWRPSDWQEAIEVLTKRRTT